MSRPLRLCSTRNICFSRPENSNAAHSRYTHTQNVLPVGIYTRGESVGEDTSEMIIEWCPDVAPYSSYNLLCQAETGWTENRSNINIPFVGRYKVVPSQVLVSYKGSGSGSSYNIFRHFINSIL